MLFAPEKFGQIGDGKLLIPEPKPWTIDVKKGGWKYLENK